MQKGERRSRRNRPRPSRNGNQPRLSFVRIRVFAKQKRRSATSLWTSRARSPRKPLWHLSEREETTEEFSAQLQAANLALVETEKKRRTAEEAELAAQGQTQAEEAKRTTELTVARQLEEERAKVREQAMHERDAEHRLKARRRTETERPQGKRWTSCGAAGRRQGSTAPRGRGARSRLGRRVDQCVPEGSFSSAPAKASGAPTSGSLFWGLAA